MWDALVENLKSEKGILSDRNNAETLKKLYESGLVFIEREGQTIVALGALWDCGNNWYELGSMWVHRDYREHNLSSNIFEKGIEFAKEHNKLVFLITYNCKIIHLAERIGMKKADKNSWLNVPIDISCGPCDRVVCKEACQYKASEKCSMFFL